MNNKVNILVLDCDHKNSLAIVRHLGKTKKYIIHSVSFNKKSVAFYSKYSTKNIITANPKLNPGQYQKDILKIISDVSYAAVIPVSYISYQLCAQIKEEINKFSHVSLAKFEHIDLASSKVKTYNLAEQLGIPYPKVFKVDSVDQISKLDLTFPIVIKAPIEVGKNIVEYANNKEAFRKKFNKINNTYDFGGILPVIQQFVDGEGAGFFAFYQNGVCKNYFVHRRLREYPVTGGASTLAESFYNDDIVRYGKKVLDHLEWEGVAMVEFKKDNQTGEYKLMEINAKFWGSLELALTAGVNFPQMIIDEALGKEIKVIDSYEQVRFQWILNGDLLHVFERPSEVFSFFKNLFLAKNDFYFTDIKPNIYQFLFIPIHYYKKWFK